MFIRNLLHLSIQKQKMEFGILSQVALEERLEVFLPRFIELEQASYPPSEAASERSLDLRVRRCADWFVFLRKKTSRPDDIVGFACGTLGLTDKIVAADAMTSHHENGNRLFLHSVVVERSLRGQGLGLALVREFIQAARKTPQVEAISLISKSKGVGLYSRAGFSFLGDSFLRHGAERWYSMELRLKTNPVVCVDAFSDQPFKGNPAAVVLLPDRPFEKVKSVEATNAAKKSRIAKNDDQKLYLGLLAREFNVSETAFVQFEELGGTGFGSTLHPLNRVVAVATCGSLTETSFNETLSTIKVHFQFRSDVKFRVGDVISEKGQNVGSLCVLSFAKACGLDPQSTARLWCEHHTNVLEHPDDAKSHPNIRSFLSGGVVEFQSAVDGSVITTPIDSFDIYGLSLLCAHDSSILSEVPAIQEVAFKLVNDHLRVSKTMSDDRRFKKFKSLFMVDEDHHTNAKKLQDVASVSKPLLAILASYNIVDVPPELVVSSLDGQSLEAFCVEHKLDDFARRRLGLGPSSPSGLALSASASLRWFTPTQVEVDLCGHATLGAAHALFFEIGPIARRGDFKTIRFQTRSGELVAAKGADGTSIMLDFPKQSVNPLDLSVEFKQLISGAFPSLDVDKDVEMVGKTSTNDHVVVVTRDAFTSRLVRPDLNALKRFGCRGVSVTCLVDEGGVDFYSRFFAPQVGIDEDPVTGSAHCFLAPFWAGRLGRTRVVGVQKSEREGRVECEVKDERVLLRGMSSVSWRGEVAKV